MKNRSQVANTVFDCASVVAAWSTAHLSHQHAVIVQRELADLSTALRRQAVRIRNGDATSVYGDTP